MKICPNCGCDQKALIECCNSTEWEERQTAYIISGNCSWCKAVIYAYRKIHQKQIAHTEKT